MCGYSDICRYGCSIITVVFTIMDMVEVTVMNVDMGMGMVIYVR